MKHVIFMSEDELISVTLWMTGPPKITVATRKHRSDMWGPPVEVIAVKS